MKRFELRISTGERLFIFDNLSKKAMDELKEKCTTHRLVSIKHKGSFYLFMYKNINYMEVAEMDFKELKK